jgi:hypothetical protein
LKCRNKLTAPFCEIYVKFLEKRQFSRKHGRFRDKKIFRNKIPRLDEISLFRDRKNTFLKCSAGGQETYVLHCLLPRTEKLAKERQSNSPKGLPLTKESPYFVANKKVNIRPQPLTFYIFWPCHLPSTFTGLKCVKIPGTNISCLGPFIVNS